MASTEDIEQEMILPTEENERPPVRRLHSSRQSGMDSSMFRFKNLNFTIGKGEKEKHIIQDVSGAIKSGRKLAAYVEEA
jgi:hypothetical protein